MSNWHLKFKKMMLQYVHVLCQLGMTTDSHALRKEKQTFALRIF